MLESAIGISAIAAYLGKDGIEKLLGPTTSYLGEALRDIAKKRIENIGKIFQAGTNKLGGKENSNGQVPPKLLNTILNDASYNEDELTIEYFGGILASSKSETGRDDRGASIAKLVDNLSTYQIRAHYIIYKTLIQAYPGTKSVSDDNARSQLLIFIPWANFENAMEFSDEELREKNNMYAHIFFGLNQQGLIESFEYGESENLKRFMSNITTGGIFCRPSVKGIELLAWGLGIGDKDNALLFKGEYPQLSTDIEISFEGVLTPID